MAQRQRRAREVLLGVPLRAAHPEIERRVRAEILTGEHVIGLRIDTSVVPERGRRIDVTRRVIAAGVPLRRTQHVPTADCVIVGRSRDVGHGPARENDEVCRLLLVAHGRRDSRRGIEEGRELIRSARVVDRSEVVARGERRAVRILQVPDLALRHVAQQGPRKLPDLCLRNATRAEQPDRQGSSRHGGHDSIGPCRYGPAMENLTHRQRFLDPASASIVRSAHRRLRPSAADGAPARPRAARARPLSRSTPPFAVSTCGSVRRSHAWLFANAMLPSTSASESCLLRELTGRSRAPTKRRAK